MNLDGNELACVPASSICQGYLPVNIAARDGLQPGDAEIALVKRTPSLAIWSKAGVFIKLLPEIEV